MTNSAKKIIEKKINIYLFILISILMTIYLFEVISLFFIAFIVAYLINPLKIYFDKFIDHTVSSFLSITIFILCVLSILILLLPVIVYQIQNLIISLPGYILEVETFFSLINKKYLISEKFKNLDYTSIFKPFTKSLISSGNNLINNSLEFINSFFNLILIVVISFYLSMEFNKIKVFIYNFAKKSNFKDFPHLIKEIDEILSKFIRGQGLVCLTLSMIYGVGLFMVGMKFGILLGIFAGMISFIPYVGSFLGGGLALILGVSQFGVSPELIFIFTIFLIGQLLESYILTPKLVGNAIKLNPIWVIFALLTGSYLYGFIGLLISLPVAAVLGVIVRYYFIKLLK